MTNSFSLFENLQMFTYGSIYIPQKELENISIINFMRKK